MAFGDTVVDEADPVLVAGGLQVKGCPKPVGGPSTEAFPEARSLAGNGTGLVLLSFATTGHDDIVKYGVDMVTDRAKDQESRNLERYKYSSR